MKVRDVMSTKITTVDPETPFREQWRTIFKGKINAVPVVDKGKKLLGIIAKEDLLKSLYPGYDELFDNYTSSLDSEKMEEKIHDVVSLKAKDVMCRRVVYTHADTPIMRALSRMIVRRLNQLPVVSSSGRLIGMVTKGDIFYALFKRHLSNKAQKQYRVHRFHSKTSGKIRKK